MTEYNDGFSSPVARSGSLRGVRAWQWNGHFLSGVWQHPWTTNGINLARCYLRSRADIAPTCGCGFYAYFTRDLNQMTLLDYRIVIGVIEGFGRMTVGTRGFRAEKARILALTYLDIPPLVGTNRRHPYLSMWVPAKELKVAQAKTSLDMPWFRDFCRRNNIPAFDNPAVMFEEFPPSRPEDALGCYPI